MRLSSSFFSCSLVLLSFLSHCGHCCPFWDNNNIQNVIDILYQLTTVTSVCLLPPVSCHQHVWLICDWKIMTLNTTEMKWNTAWQGSERQSEPVTNCSTTPEWFSLINIQSGVFLCEFTEYREEISNDSKKNEAHTMDVSSLRVILGLRLLLFRWGGGKGQRKECIENVCWPLVWVRLEWRRKNTEDKHKSYAL